MSLLLALPATTAMTWGYFELPNTTLGDYISKQKGGWLQYLTIQGLALAWVTFVFGILASVTGWGLFRRLKRTIFLVSMPLAVVISSIYWTLLLMFPALIVSKDPRVTEISSSEEVPQDIRLRFEHDIALHAVPGLSLFLDFMIFEKPYAGWAPKLGAPAMSLLFAVWYGSWVEHCAAFNGEFPYPFLDMNPYPVRVAIYAGAAAIALVSFYFINGLRSPPKKTIDN